MTESCYLLTRTAKHPAQLLTYPKTFLCTSRLPDPLTFSTMFPLKALTSWGFKDTDLVGHLCSLKPTVYLLLLQSLWHCALCEAIVAQQLNAFSLLGYNHGLESEPGFRIFGGQVQGTQSHLASCEVCRRRRLTSVLIQTSTSCWTVDGLCGLSVLACLWAPRLVTQMSQCYLHGTGAIR